MQQLTMLITAEGNWVLPESEEFLAALGDPEPDYDAVGFAVRNLGFVKFQLLDRIVTEIELCPRNVDLRALLALEKLLGEVGTNLFRIKYLNGEWHSEISSSAEHTIARVRELCAPVFEAPTSERFHIEERDPAVLFSQAQRNEGLGPMAMKWRVAFGHFDTGVMAFAGRHDMLPRSVLLTFEDNNTRPILRFMGGAQRWGGEHYRLDGVGQPIENMPDKEYGAWCSQFYKSVAQSGQPRFDLVTAQMEYHAEPGKPRRTRIYERLLLPWRTESGETLVTSFAKLVPGKSGANLELAGSDNSSARKVPKSS
ncbi:MAG TPA: hypothetical protein VG308_10420 [Stellaceae bacterium]|nr:hypothetical protein [Stellaceae bacterium]